MEIKNLGLLYRDNYISIDQKLFLIAQIEKFRVDNPKSIAGYGDHNYDSIYFGERYNKSTVDFPDYILDLSNKLIQDSFFAELPFGVAINKYKKGQKIGAHIDKPISGPIVTIISLGSESTMIFKNKQYNDIVQLLADRSLVQMKDSIRNEWTHEILPVPSTRYSIIFRSHK